MRGKKQIMRQHRRLIHPDTHAAMDAAIAAAWRERGACFACRNHFRLRQR